MLGKLDRHTIGQRDESHPRDGPTGCGFARSRPERRRRHDTGGPGFSPDFSRRKVGLPPRVRCAKPPLAPARGTNLRLISEGLSEPSAPRATRGSLARLLGAAWGAGLYGAGELRGLDHP